MSSFLRQSTNSQSRSISAFVSDTDFKTAQTGLTIANTDVKLLKNGAASVNKNSGGGTHRANGSYSLTFDSTDTDTVGELEVTISVSGALVAWKTFWVLEEAVYDALVAASAPGYVTDQPVNATKIGGTTQTGRDLGASVLLSPGSGTGQIDLSSGKVLLQATQSGVTIPTVTTLTNAPSDSSGVTTLLSRLSATRAGYLDNLSAGAVALEASITTVLSKLLKYFQLALRKDAAIATDNATELTALNANGGSGAGAYANTTDALESNRDNIGTAGAALTAIPWNAAWDAEVESEVADALEATIADSIPADGTRPSIKQGIYMMTQFMLERNVSSTTVTVKKADGTTSLFTLTLNDATTPTSITRAT